ncbi:ABC transporter ATP-binding protein [Paenalkalicoccus suaedae]|uniref:ABC transporter ATP-binding protein n=1 Tax=Paenalkalicoccus suaedae TaxID=2592382 RepID=A0A859FJM7_9BACI|nr:ABC transporter ATP-binding protein [Paenalkalicoccus suaedae]QKS73011.1 ABC transporter ATP-binding protein [Paenalkalicoccus suaedae]
MTAFVQVTNVHKQYGKGEQATHALKDISFTIEHGEFLGIMGPSGSGKSTLLNVLATIDAPTSGDITIDGQQIASLEDKQLADFRRRHLGFIFQDYHLLDSLTVRENIILPLALAKSSVNEIDERLQAITEAFHIDDLLNKYPYQLSGGQKQRTAASRAIITNPKLILADEPTGALDSKSATDLLSRMQKLNETEETLIMMVTHDAYAASFCRRILFIQDGQVSRELYRGTKTRNEFFQQILAELAQTGGGSDDHY